MFHFIIPYQNQNYTIRDFLRAQNLSTSLRRKIKHSGKIFLNAQPATWMEKLSIGDSLQITLPVLQKFSPVFLPFTIIYEDSSLIIIDKPAGILTHPISGKTEPSLAEGLTWYYSQKGKIHSFHPTHRLDRNTSGMLLIAKNPHIHHLLTTQKSLQRTYYALLSTTPEFEAGTLTFPIARSPVSIIAREVHPYGQPAITYYRILAKYNQACLAEVRLGTGRTHQIRVHFSHIHCPLLGDDLYGGNRNIINRHALHAGRLTLKHPLTNKQLSFRCPLPDDIRLAIHFTKHSKE